MTLLGRRPTHLVLDSLAVIALSLSGIALTHADAPSTVHQISAQHDGQHDFDFMFGTWHTHIKKLQNPLTGSSTWVEMNGTKAVRKIWGGRAQLEEIEADSPSGHFEFLTLFLYNPQSHQWSQTGASSASGTLGQPAFGEFKNGRAEFLSQEEFKGRQILVRAAWSDITPESHHFEQSFSEDGGKTWEPNFIATLTRDKP